VVVLWRICRYQLAAATGLENLMLLLLGCIFSRPWWEFMVVWLEETSSGAGFPFWTKVII
jgi:hypothetical protein